MAEASPRPWRTWALIASLGLNLVFAGLVAGAFWRGPPPPPAMPGFGQYARALPEPYRQDLGRALRHSRPDWDTMRDAWLARRAAFAAALTAEPFDPAAVTTLMQEDGRLGDDLAARGGRLLLEQIVRMSPDERAAYAQAVLDSRPGRDGPGHRPPRP